MTVSSHRSRMHYIWLWDAAIFTSQIKTAEEEISQPPQSCAPLDLSPTISPVSTTSAYSAKATLESNIPLSVIQANSNSYEGYTATKDERAAIQSLPQDFLRRQFPKAHQSPIRERVRREIINTDWWLNNQLEPQHYLHSYIQRVKSKTFVCTACGKEVSFL
jgi:hypothetical protein